MSTAQAQHVTLVWLLLLDTINNSLCFFVLVIDLGRVSSSNIFLLHEHEPKQRNKKQKRTLDCSIAFLSRFISPPPRPWKRIWISLTKEAPFRNLHRSISQLQWWVGFYLYSFLSICRFNLISVMFFWLKVNSFSLPLGSLVVDLCENPIDWLIDACSGLKRPVL